MEEAGRGKDGINGGEVRPWGSWTDVGFVGFTLKLLTSFINQWTHTYVCLNQGLANDNSPIKSGPLSVSVNRVLLKLSHIHPFVQSLPVLTLPGRDEKFQQSPVACRDENVTLWLLAELVC